LARDFLSEIDATDWDALQTPEHIADVKPTFDHFLEKIDELLESAEHYDTGLNLAEQGAEWGLANPRRVFNWGHAAGNIGKFNQWMADNGVRWSDVAKDFKPAHPRWSEHVWHPPDNPL
jgi:hypothetical protein